MVERALAIANYFIKLSQDKGQELTPMKLIKISYISHGWNLALYDESLIDEVIYAWKYGPVIESVFHAFKPYGDKQIEELYRTHTGYPMPSPENIVLLNKVWEVYGASDGIKLSALTHKEGTPWDIVWNKRGGKDKKHAIIPNDLIKTYYKDKIALPQDANPEPAGH
jgi:uncharacterized phage-associated protein